MGNSVIDFKAGFFDRKLVLDKTDQATRRVLSRFGAYVRRRAQTSIRPTSKKQMAEIAALRKQLALRRGNLRQAAARLEVLYEKTGSRPGQPPRGKLGLLRKWILFAYDRQRRSVVIGAADLGRKTQAPENLEHGGRARIGGAVRTVEARPFMGPALDAELPKLMPLWKDAIK